MTEFRYTEYSILEGPRDPYVETKRTLETFAGSAQYWVLSKSGEILHIGVYDGSKELQKLLGKEFRGRGVTALHFPVSVKPAFLANFVKIGEGVGRTGESFGYLFIPANPEWLFAKPGNFVLLVTHDANPLIELEVIEKPIS